MHKVILLPKKGVVFEFFLRCHEIHNNSFYFEYQNVKINVKFFIYIFVSKKELKNLIHAIFNTKVSKSIQKNLCTFLC